MRCWRALARNVRLLLRVVGGKLSFRVSAAKNCENYRKHWAKNYRQSRLNPVSCRGKFRGSWKLSWLFLTVFMIQNLARRMQGYAAYLSFFSTLYLYLTTTARLQGVLSADIRVKIYTSDCGNFCLEPCVIIDYITCQWLVTNIVHNLLNKKLVISLNWCWQIFCTIQTIYLDNRFINFHALILSLNLLDHVLVIILRPWWNLWRYGRITHWLNNWPCGTQLLENPKNLKSLIKDPL